METSTPFCGLTFNGSPTTLQQGDKLMVRLSDSCLSVVRDQTALKLVPNNDDRISLTPDLRQIHQSEVLQVLTFVSMALGLSLERQQANEGYVVYLLI